MIIVALALLAVRLSSFLGHIDDGLLAALDLYPPDNGEAVGYDMVTLAEVAFVVYVGCRFVWSKIRRPQPPPLPKAGG